MARRCFAFGLLTVVLLLSGCGQRSTPTAQPVTPTLQLVTPTPESTTAPTGVQDGVLISELLPGVAGTNNNLEFIELYNAGSLAVDLQGWSLWYRMDDNREETLVYTWQDRADIPGHGHLLLVRAGQDVGNIGDAEFDTPLFERRGGLALRDADNQTIDTLVWGDGPTEYRAGSPADVPEPGTSLQRLPGGDMGSTIRTGDHGADFALNPTPSPQNSGDPVTPLPERRLAIQLDGAKRVGPGGEWEYTVQIQNLTGAPVSGARAFLPVPDGFEILSTPAGVTQADGWLEWTLPDLGADASEAGDFVLQSPWTYLSTLVAGYYVEADDGTTRSYGPISPLAVEGGSIPIATARTLKGKRVTVEGVATMFTDGFYAGTTGTKFYMEDDTGGIQVYCPGGMGLVQVAVGDTVRVTGDIDVYSGSIEIIPGTYPDDVEMLAQGGEPPEPAAVSLATATKDEAVLGRLIATQGLATRIEEFTYSYEMDLMDDQGNRLLAYIDKETGVTTDPLDLGEQYKVTGISEIYDGMWQIKPRFQTDFAQVFRSELRLEIDARNSVLPGEVIEYSLTAYNHTDAALTDLQIVVTPPSEGVTSIELVDGSVAQGLWDGDDIVWQIPQLAGQGGSATVRFAAVVDPGATGQIAIDPGSAMAAEWSDPALSGPFVTFVGSGVPIWAIQGPGAASPYVRDQVTTSGIVIGVFPELHGFWIQEPETDDDPATSAGLFVLVGDLETSLSLGDEVRLSGTIRERSGQTMLQLLSSEDVTVVSSGNTLPDAAELDPPMDDIEAWAYYEALEGMLVKVTDPAVAVGPTSKYGETPLVRASWAVERIMRGDPRGFLIFVDDGSDMTHNDLTTLPFALKTGDSVVDIEGPLAYTYENYKIEPILPPVVTAAERPLPSLAPSGPGEFSVATFNVQDLFDPYDPHPTDPPIPTTAQYKLDLAKTADAILAMGAPTIVGLQEVENLDILADLAEEPALSPYAYAPVLIEGTDSRGIDNGYLVRGDQATLEGFASLVAPEGLTSRPPLLITVTVHLQGSDSTVYILNNHFTSMSGGELPTEPRRTAQAAWNVELVERILEDEPDAQVIVLGDLNSFYRSPPMDEFRKAGLRHVYEYVEPDLPYTYIYEGESETLDHVWVTPSLYQRLLRVEVLHIDADFTLPPPDDATAMHVSDHDPLVVVFSVD